MNLNEIIMNLSNEKLENELLGAVLVKPELIKEFYLKPEVFTNNINKDIYTAMKSLDIRGYSIDIASVLETANEMKLINKAEMPLHVRNLFDMGFTERNILYKLDKIQELHMKREQARMAYKILENVVDNDFEKMDRAIDNALKKIKESKPSKKETHIGNYLEELILDMEQDKGQLEGSPTHMKDLDKIMNGMRKKELVIIGANPSVGKTVLATNIAERHALKNNGITAIFSLEMSGLSLSKRMISSLTNIHSDKIKTAAQNFTSKDWVDTMTLVGIMTQTKTHIVEDTSLTIEDIRRESYRIKEKYKDTNEHMVILIDYLGLIKKVDPRQQTREHMKDVAVGLKNLSKELDCTVIALSQLSRDNEKDKRKPIMADLKESGDIEAAADTIILLHREDYQGRETEKKNIIELIVAKNRNGATGSAEMKFMKHLSKFLDIG